MNEMIQCKVCERHNARGKSFCTCGVIVQELSAENTKNAQRNRGACDDSLQRFAVSSLDKRPDKAPHFSQASQDHQTAKHHFQNAFKKNPIFAQIDGKVTQTFESACKKVAARTKPWKVATKSQVYQEKPTKSRRIKNKCNLGTNGMSRSVEFMLVAKWLNAFFCEVFKWPRATLLTSCSCIAEAQSQEGPRVFLNGLVYALQTRFFVQVK